MFYIITQAGISLFTKTGPKVIGNSDIRFDKVLKAIKENDEEAIELLTEPKQAITKTNLEIIGNEVCYNKKPIHNELTRRIIQQVQEGFNIEPMLKFLIKTMNNPNKQAAERIYEFLEYSQMPITPEGNFIAYKRVNNDLTSVYDKKTKHEINQVTEMERSECDEDSNKTCSRGLHFCAQAYLKHFEGDRILVLEVNPEDVTAVPYDYDNAKGRTCKYKVIGELDEQMKQKAIKEEIKHRVTTQEAKPIQPQTINKEVVRLVIKAKQAKKKATHYLNETHQKDVVSINEALLQWRNKK